MSRALLYTALLACSPAVALAAVPDGTIVNYAGRQWSTLTDDPAHLSLVQSNDVLGVTSTPGGSPNDDALYESTFGLSTANDFSLRANYTLGNTVAGFGGVNDAVGLDFGVGRDADGTDSAAIGVGAAAGGLATASEIAYRVDDAQTTGRTEAFSPRGGTLEIDYSAASDRLTFSRVGSTFGYSLPDGTVRGTWGADQLIVSLGGRGSGITVAPGQADFLSFSVVNGTVVPLAPEPAALATVGAGALLLRRRRS